MKSLFVPFALAGVLLGCSGDTASNTAADSAATPAANTEMNSANTGSTAMNAPDEPAAVSFASLQPTLQKCTMCHGESNPKEGLRLTSYENLMKGGEHGAVVVPGDPENSRLVHALRGSHGIMRMPAKADPLPEETIQQVEAWIKAGAKP